MSKKILILATIFILAALVGGVLWVAKEKSERMALEKQNKERTAQMQNKQDEPKQLDNFGQNSDIDTSNWKMYRNEEYGFEVKYPEEWIATIPNKNIYNEVLSLTSRDTDSKLIGAQNQAGDNIVIHVLANVREDAHVKNVGGNVKSLEDFLNLDVSQTEVKLIEKIEFVGRPAYLVGVFGLTGHYCIFFETESGVYKIVFEKTNLSMNQGKQMENKLTDILSKQEINVLNSLRIL